MKLSDVRVGAAVRVTRGYGRRPAIVTEVFNDGRVSVSFTDVDRKDPAVLAIPATHRSNLFGAVVRPNALAAEGA